MEPVMILTDLGLLAAGFAAGAFGALLGIGGGVIIVPVLVLFAKVPIRTAIGTSFIAVLATSLSAASLYLKTDLCDMETGLSLESATVPGAVAGAYAAGVVNQKLLLLAFGLIMFYIFFSMVGSRKRVVETRDFKVPYSEKEKLIAHFASFFAGTLSGALGVGGGLVKVPILSKVLRFPMARAIATSSYMIGITVASSTIVFTIRGDMDPFLAAPLVAGIFLGARQGARLMPHLPENVLKLIFSMLLLYFGIRFLFIGMSGNG